MKNYLWNGISVSEFFLLESFSYPWLSPRYRIAVGDLVDASLRQALPVTELNPETGFKTGSMAFLDFRYREDTLPDSSKPSGQIDVDAIVVTSSGTEPKYRGRGIAKFLLNRAEEIAKKEDLTAIIIDTLKPEYEPVTRHILLKAGFTFSGEGAYKRL